MDIEQLISKLKQQPQEVEFDDVIATIDDHYRFEPTAFNNGSLANAAGQNNGSCKIFSFAKHHRLDEQQTLHCFGRYYRDEVLAEPDGDSHQNIRHFMQTGWNGLHLEADALTAI